MWYTNFTFVVKKCYICGNLYYIYAVGLFFTYVVDFYICDQTFSHMWDVLHLWEFLHFDGVTHVWM